jgi:hypothetical protein
MGDHIDGMLKPYDSLSCQGDINTMQSIDKDENTEPEETP